MRNAVVILRLCHKQKQRRNERIDRKDRSNGYDIVGFFHNDYVDKNLLFSPKAQLSAEQFPCHSPSRQCLRGRVFVRRRSARRAEQGEAAFRRSDAGACSQGLRAGRSCRGSSGTRFYGHNISHSSPKLPLSKERFPRPVSYPGTPLPGEWVRFIRTIWTYAKLRKRNDAFVIFGIII